MTTALAVLSKMADPTSITFGRVEMAYALFVAIYASLAWFAPNTQEIMGYDHENRTVGEGLRAEPGVGGPRVDYSTNNDVAMITASRTKRTRNPLLPAKRSTRATAAQTTSLERQ